MLNLQAPDMTHQLLAETAAALAGASNVYKIKLRETGYRLVYAVEDHVVTVTVIAVGKRERNACSPMVANLATRRHIRL